MPYWDFNARGIMVGWTGAHGKAHAYRAILERIAFEQRPMTDGAESAFEKPVGYLLAMASRGEVWLNRFDRYSETLELAFDFLRRIPSLLGSRSQDQSRRIPAERTIS